MLRVIKLIAREKNIKEIALRMKLSAKTVQFHWHAAKVAHGFKSYVGAARWAYKKGLVKL